MAYSRSDIGNPAAFIFHHTGGRSDPMPTLQQRGLGVQYIMDRDGAIRQVGGAGASHIQPGSGAGAGLSNANTAGMEVIAKDNRDVTPAQVEAARKFITENYPGIRVYGHGEVNPGHKQPDEGMAIVNAIRGAQAQPPGPAPTYQPEDPRALADRKTLSLPEMPRGPFAPQPMQVAHNGALAGFPPGFGIPQSAPPQSPAGGPLPLFPSNAMASAQPAQGAPGVPTSLAPQPGPAGAPGGPQSFWDMISAASGQGGAPNPPLFGARDPQASEAAMNSSGYPFRFYRE